LLGGGLALEGLIAGFGIPSQGCPDGLGNIFIPDILNGHVMKFAYGETSPLATLPAPSAPFGCSIDRATGSGNLAVTQEGNDTVLVFPNASGTPTSYSLPNITAPEYVAYDQSGDLFVDGIDPSNAAALAELPSGGTSFVPLTIAGGTVNVADNIEWGGTYLLVGDQVNSSSVIDRMTVSGSTATIVDTVSLIRSQEVVGFWPRGPANDKWIATADFTAQDAAVYTWPGGQLHALVTEDISHPIGATIVQRARAGP
jgi:DNA-binding beta-propeller fold protein YncE